MNSYTLNILRSLISIFILIPFAVGAHNKVVVVPLLEEMEGLQNVISVSKNNGDFKDVSSALDSIKDASAANPYLIIVGPGFYGVTSTIVMKDYVSLSGSGQGITTLSGSSLRGNRRSDAAVIKTASYSRINNMTIRNRGGGGSSIGIFNESTTESSLSDVDIVVFGGLSRNVGFEHELVSGSTPSTITDSTLKVSGAGSTTNIGINAESSDSAFKNLDIRVISRLGRSIGIRYGTTGGSFSDVSISAISSNESYGVRIVGAGAPGFGGAFVDIRDSKIRAATAALSAGPGDEIQATHSSLNSDGNNISDDGGSFICLFSDNQKGAELGSDCEL